MLGKYWHGRKIIRVVFMVKFAPAKTDTGGRYCQLKE
jgi:hypothetical protein